MPTLAARILVVEDEEETSNFLVEYFSSQGYRASAVYDGPSALDSMRDQPPALAIVDLMLPGMGGFEIIRRMRLDSALAHVPILVCTARREACFPADSVQAVVYKPFDLTELGAQVRALVESNTSHP